MVSGNVELLSEFYDQLKDSESPVLLLDYDGTLAPFTVDRLRAFPSPGVREILNKILAYGKTRVVFISGRNSEEVVKLAGLDHGVEVWGCHGREHLTPEGRIEVVGLTDEMRSALANGEDCARDTVPSYRVELKAGCVAVHWRGMKDDARGALKQDLREMWGPIAERGELVIKNFDGGLELMAPGRTKGDVVEHILNELDGSDYAVAFLGDDLTDEDGFRALGERGLSILVRNEERESEAPVRLAQPDGLLDFLHKWHMYTSRESS